MEELLMCSVCIERYSEKQRHPILLPRCGHSFCRSCVAMLISGGCITCPTCRTDQRVESADKLPTEYTLLAIIHAQESTKKETCERHSVKLSFWCRTCEISTCGECLFEDHPTHSHDVIRAAKYIADMKLNAQEVAVKFMEVLDEREQIFYKIIFNSTKNISNALRNVNVLRKDMEDARELMKGIKEEESIIAATSLSEAAKFLGLKWNIQDANFNRKKKEAEAAANEKDEIDIAKEKAAKEMAVEKEREKAEAEAAAAAEAEDKALKEKAKESRRLLRKSRTLSCIETAKETEKMKEEKLKLVVSADKLKPKEMENKLNDVEDPKLMVDLSEKKETKKDEKKLPEEIKLKDLHKIKEGPRTTKEELQSTKEELLSVKEELKLIKEELHAAKEELNSSSKEELTNPKEELKSLTEELKSPAEVLKSSKEDLKSPQEELSSSKEELKSSKEELQSPKEELKSPQKDELKSPSIESKEAESVFKGEKVSDLPAVKPKGKFIFKRTIKKPEQASAEEKSPTKEVLEPLPIIPEAVIAEVKSKVFPEDNASQNEDKKLVVSLEENKDQEKETEVVDEEKHEQSDSSQAVPEKIKDPFEDKFEYQEKLTDCIQVPGFMICAETPDGRLAELEWGPQGLHVHCLQYTQVTYDIMIKCAMLNAIIPSKSPIVFLELSAEHTILGKVYIKLWGHLKRAHNFLSLCLGDQGKSYLNTKFLQVYNISSSGERMLGGDYEHNNGRGGHGLFDDMEWNGDYAMPMKAGMITAAGSGQASTNSLFLLCTQSDDSRNFSCPFGTVCEGLKVAKEAVQQTATKQVWISNCGVLIVPPKL